MSRCLAVAPVLALSIAVQGCSSQELPSSDDESAKESAEGGSDGSLDKKPNGDNELVEAATGGGEIGAGGSGEEEVPSSASSGGVPSSTSSGGVPSSTSSGGVASSASSGGVPGTAVDENPDTCSQQADSPPPDLSGSLRLIYSGGGKGLFEGPVWIGDALYFSDIRFESDVPPSSILKLVPPSTEPETFLADSGSNGLWSSDAGGLLACVHSSQSISLISLPDGSTSTRASAYGGLGFNAPNDLVVRADGTIYFTDPDYQLGNRPSPLGFTGVFRVAPDGAVSLVDDSLANPNGIILSPDEERLYVGESSGVIFVYEVAPDGVPHTRQALIENIPGPDGMTVDCAGNIYVAAHDGGKVHVFAPDGVELGSVLVGPNVTNVTFGGEHRQTLYITAEKKLFALQLNIPG